MTKKPKAPRRPSKAKPLVAKPVRAARRKDDVVPSGRDATPLSDSPTTSQRLGSILKSARDIMRKDKGLNGDLDRLPMLTWIMFLKFLDDMETLRAEAAALSGERYRPAIEPPYRWRDWAAREDGITGDELIAFINQEECRRPDSTSGPGLFAYLRSLSGVNVRDRRDVVAAVFKGTVSRMINGYLLRDVINKVNGIHFTSTDEIHVLGNFYESMLKEMRDVAGDSGEFYTPRPLIRFVVSMVDPQIGETVLDPACGTGGFLVEAFSYLERQCNTVAQRRQLQRATIYGGEAKPLPFMLSQMNLLLHGLESPTVDSGNSLAVPLREIGDRDRVDVILTNPPFGGEEERGILSNFPEDLQTAETALLFLQLIMKKLKRRKGTQAGGRAAVVVPDGTLFCTGVGARIKAQLLQEFNLHTVLRLPYGVFEPYTPIRSNVLFFDTQGSTETIWFYEINIQDGRKKYTKTKPLRFEELSECEEWWNSRCVTDNAWRVSAEDVLAKDCNLDIQNPSRSDTALPTDPGDLLKLANANHEEITRALAALNEIVGAMQ
jgi:type I restriction enzyme M protein